MKNFRQVFLAIMIALASFGLILGGLSLSLTEVTVSSTLAPTHTFTQTGSPTSLPLTPSEESPTPSLTLTPSLTSTWTVSLTPTPTNCPPPPGWVPYAIMSGDTLNKVAIYHRIGSAELQQANCLLATGLLPGTVIYVPQVPTQTPLLTRRSLPTQIPLLCGRPYSWVVYFVQPGDTLYRLSLAYGISVADLQRANCMGGSTLLHTGKSLFVPPWSPLIPCPTRPFIVPPYATLPGIQDYYLPTDTPVEASTSIPTDTPIPFATEFPTEAPMEDPISITP
jgi:LysM repeat protein